MNKKGRILALMLFSITGPGLWSSCTPEEGAHAPANIKATFALRSTSAMDGKVTIEEAFLKLSHIDVSGNYQGNSRPTVSHRISPDDPPFRLSSADSSRAIFHLPSHVYDQLDFHLFLLQDDYELMIRENTNNDVGEENDAPDNTGNSNNGGGPVNEEGNQDEHDNDDHQDQDENDDDDDKDHDKDGDDKGNDDDDDDDEDDDDQDEDDGKDDDKDDKKNDKKDKNDDDDKDDDDDDDKDDDDGRSAASGRSVDIDHFFQNARPGLVIIGNYQSNKAVLKIIFVLDGVEKYTLRGRQNDSPAIRLAQENTAEVTFNPAHWFTSITENMIESGTTQTYQGQQIIFIHKSFNSHLYEALAPALEASGDLNIIPGGGGP